MGRLKLYAAVAGFLAASSVAAHAADLLPPMPAPEPAPFDFEGGSWYLRGDVGVSNYQGGKFSSRDFPGTTFFGEDYGSGAFAGGGVGYQFNSWFRADVTGEYRFSTGVKVHDYAGFAVGDGTFGNSNETNQGNYNAAVVLLNGYFDLGTWYGVTPFVGAGVGLAHNRFSGFDDRSLTSIDGATFPSGGTIREGTKDNFAWAIHAGLGYDVSPNLKLELAYRYLNLGDAKTGQINCYCGEVYQPLRAKELESHDIKIGMRWMLGEATPVEQPPLIRKY